MHKLGRIETPVGVEQSLKRWYDIIAESFKLAAEYPFAGARENPTKRFLFDKSMLPVTKKVLGRTGGRSHEIRYVIHGNKETNYGRLEIIPAGIIRIINNPLNTVETVRDFSSLAKKLA